MSSQANHFKLGLFVLLGLALAFVTLLVIGVGHIWLAVCDKLVMGSDFIQQSSRST